MVQWACSNVYFRYRIRFSPLSSREKHGTVWKRLQPTERSRASELFNSFGCQRWRFTLVWTKPMRDSPGSSPPRMRGLSPRMAETHAAGTSSRRTRTKVPIGKLSEKPCSGSAPEVSLLSSSFGAFPSSASGSSFSSFSSSLFCSSSGSSSSAELHPPVMNFRAFRASRLSSSHGLSSPGRIAMRTVSTAFRSAMLPNNVLWLSSCLPWEASSSSSSSNKGTVAWSVGSTIPLPSLEEALPPTCSLATEPWP
mmetsp:Transcript_45673/g.106774  ORF Transcript_45673/g.106774 Transcript_45673/m.106774 type:complete len:252 (+) Transcript_45673:212-967(+)